MTRFIFITGGVVSSLGKGLSAAALGFDHEAQAARIVALVRRLRLVLLRDWVQRRAVIYFASRRRRGNFAP